MANKTLTIKEVTFKELFTFNAKKLVIPEYQRPYVWDTEKVNDLIKDLQEFFSEEEKLHFQVDEYYLGYILLFDNPEKDQLEVIDGQQRLTTLLIMQHLLLNSNSGTENITFNSQLSVNNIITIRDFLKGRKAEMEDLHAKNFLDKLRFTVIITKKADEAFTFFDTHNNRAVTLGATDFLKAYHLRAIKSEKIQDKVAQTWESNDDSDLELLFYKFLWRGRNWKGNNIIELENKDAVLKTFQKQTQKNKLLADCSYPLYPNSKNQFAIRELWSEDGNVELTTMPINLVNEIDYPFSLRQPIHDGLNFFHYTQKYLAIRDFLIKENVIGNVEIEKMRDFYNSVYTDDMSAYLRQFMMLCLILYYDNFGTERIFEAVCHFDYLIGESRLSKKQIRQESISHILIDNNLNVLDVIVQAYLSNEVFEYLQNLTKIEEKYKNIVFEKEEKSVRTRYYDRLKKYYKPYNDLKNRKSWKR
jgi:hypothetical protein